MKTAQLFLFATFLALGTAAARAEDSATTAQPADAATQAAPVKKAKKSADGASKKKAKKKKALTVNDTAPLQEVSVPMAKGELEAEVANDVAQRERANAPRTKVELNVSTWKPTQVTNSSRIANATDFQTKGIPAMNVAFFAPLVGRQLNLEFGAGFLALNRTGTINTGGVSVAQDQNAYVMNLRVGVAYQPWLLLGDSLIPYVSATVLPTVLMTKQSAFDDGVSDTGVPFELGAGTTFRVSKPVSLDVGVSEELGTVQSSNFKGFGVRAGVRVAI
jgi:hypothetical protein